MYGNADQKFDLTAGLGTTLLYGDIKHETNLGFGAVLKLDYKVYKGLYLGVEGQMGRLRAKGDDNPLSPDWDPRHVTNQFYYTGLFNATVYPYRFFVNERELFRRSGFEKIILNGFYVALGAGGIFNNYAKIERATTYRYQSADGLEEIVHQIPEGLVNGPYESQTRTDAAGNVTERKVYKDRSRDILFPVANVGLAIPLNKYSSYGSAGYFTLVLNTQFTFSQGEDLDGYNPLDSNGQSASKYNDMYNFSYLGVRYTF